ncbi:tRNA 2-selenouridine(34) synthase MnmH [bacterium]|nr:tRNA 2-selenouridine(34) synthase MnmH [bacterium]
MKSLSGLADAGFDAVIDVRSPAEFAEDHIPGAINLPVLSDEERARVGTVYVQDSPFKARKMGAALVSRNAALHLEGPLAEMEGGWRPLVYCWRGGQRSGSFAMILSQIGWRAETLEGGYRSYRSLVVRRLHDVTFPTPVVLLDGNTGTAKTDILARLPALGVQVIDLEGLANHRGSALGAYGDQPAQKGFETKLAAAVEALDPARPVVIEAESSRIGKLNLPARVFEAMKHARRIEVAAPLEARAEYLVRAYADVTRDPEVLVSRMEALVRLQGHARVAEWVAMARQGDFRELAAELMRHHYDVRYAKGRGARKAGTVMVSAERLDEAGIDRLADQVAGMVMSEPVSALSE